MELKASLSCLSETKKESVITLYPQKIKNLKQTLDQWVLKMLFFTHKRISPTLRKPYLVGTAPCSFPSSETGTF